MPVRDYYQILGVARDASQDEIKRAYRRLSRKYHPDVSTEPYAEQSFQTVTEAYETLKDPERRAAYDLRGAGWRVRSDFRPPPDEPESFSSGREGVSEGFAGDFGDLFEGLFGSPFRSTRSSRGWRREFGRRGADEYVRLPIDLEDSFHGPIRTLTLELRETDARGRAYRRTQELQVRIPKGVIEGERIRVPGYGGAPLGQESYGDLYLEVVFRPHPHFRVEGRDLYLDLPVAPWEAALGARVRVPTPGGVVRLQIPAGSSAGRELCLTGRGLPGNPPGNLYVKLQIVLPPADSRRAKELYRQMERELAFNPRADLEDGRDS
jgi:curved DNA-binding protein